MPDQTTKSLKSKLANINEGELIQTVRIIRAHVSELEVDLEAAEEAAKAAPAAAPAKAE